ncbi:hypothetical protein NMY22_g6319 [Coprinellus aureogranulatus]|nr:hypothetical protein NMY22_g6319 [Coprinellus aureogranulatus]
MTPKSPTPPTVQHQSAAVTPTVEAPIVGLTSTQGPSLLETLSVDPSILQNLSHLAQLLTNPGLAELSMALQQHTPQHTPSRGLADSLGKVHLDSSPSKLWAPSASSGGRPSISAGRSQHDEQLGDGGNTRAVTDGSVMERGTGRGGGRVANQRPEQRLGSGVDGETKSGRTGVRGRRERKVIQRGVETTGTGLDCPGNGCAFGFGLDDDGFWRRTEYSE